jgi:hypothetical protein
MGLKVVHINTVEVRKDVEVRTMWEKVLKPKWEEQARERGTKLLAELTGEKPVRPGSLPPKLRG